MTWMSAPALESALRPLAEAALATCDGVLARIWLTGPGDRCADCPMRPECPDQRTCLHLVASAGQSLRIDGPFRRFPIGAREVGRVPLTREPFVALKDLAALGLAERTWLATHGVQSFAALPLEHGGACIGVLAVFSRGMLTDHELDALGAAARLGALALGNLRAFRELAAGRNRLAARMSRRETPPEPAPNPSAALRPLAETERETIARVLAHTGGKVSGPKGAAAILGLKPTTLFSRMKKLGVSRKPEEQADRRA